MNSYDQIIELMKKTADLLDNIHVSLTEKEMAELLEKYGKLGKLLEKYSTGNS